MLLLVCALSCACHCCRTTRALTILPGTGWVGDNSRICHCAGRSAWQSTGGRGTLLCRWPTAACSSKDMTRVTHIHSAYVDSICWLQDTQPVLQLLKNWPQHHGMVWLQAGHAPTAARPVTYTPRSMPTCWMKTVYCRRLRRSVSGSMPCCMLGDLASCSRV